jgi:hypothetical protein
MHTSTGVEGDEDAEKRQMLDVCVLTNFDLHWPSLRCRVVAINGFV